MSQSVKHSESLSKLETGGAHGDSSLDTVAVGRLFWRMMPLEGGPAMGCDKKHLLSTSQSLAGLNLPVVPLAPGEGCAPPLPAMSTRYNSQSQGARAEKREEQRVTFPGPSD